MPKLILDPKTDHTAYNDTKMVQNYFKLSIIGKRLDIENKNNPKCIENYAIRAKNAGELAELNTMYDLSSTMQWLTLMLP